MENIRSANSESSVRHVLGCEGFDSSEAKDTSYQQNTSARNGPTADGCYFNVVFNDSSETIGDELDAVASFGTTGSVPTAVSNPSATVRLTVPSSPMVSADGSQPFRRSHSMRSSFNSLRSLRTRLKHSTNAYSTGSSGTVYCHLPTVGDLARSPSAGSTKQSTSRNSSNSSSSAHFARSTSDDMRRSLRHKLHKLKITYNELRRLQTKVLQDKRTLDDDTAVNGSACAATLPENIPPKAAALLMEGFSRKNSVQSSLKVHRRPPEANTSVIVVRASSVRVKEERCPPFPVAQPVETLATADQGTNLKVVRKQPKQEAEQTSNLAVIGGNVASQPVEREKKQDKVASEVEVSNRPVDQQSASHGQPPPHHVQQHRAPLTVTRTATIRKGSVWANNTTSKRTFGRVLSGMGGNWMEKFSRTHPLSVEPWEWGTNNYSNFTRAQEEAKVANARQRRQIASVSGDSFGVAIPIGLTILKDLLPYAPYV
uniref:Uncharacterized protein n=1 Tax=Anopheles maculatus TaxID=74869 RepID=A0A182S7C8_9DIPT